jgi:uncharacterized repeat protein (TIGR03803 family)
MKVIYYFKQRIKTRIMKKSLLLSFILLCTISLFAQTKIWGVCGVSGPSLGGGTLFRCDADGSNPVVMYEFDLASGSMPWSPPIRANDGNFYGTTYDGGQNNMGVLYRFDPVNNVYTKLKDMDGANSGSYPVASLIQASNGKLYGTTSEGGLDDSGIIFEFDPVSGIFKKKKDFYYSITGGCPYGKLFQANNGKLYQLLIGGPTNNDKGTLVEYDLIQETLIRKITFNGTNGAYPYGSLVQLASGKLYGTTNQGGATWCGVIFDYDITTEGFSVLYTFDGPNHGRAPTSNLNIGFDGNLYGMTELGGLNDKGVLFRFNPNSNLVVNLMDFDGANLGARPLGDLMTASNNKMYGFTSDGGTQNHGVLFEFDPVSNVFAKKVDFVDSLGTFPMYGALFEAPFTVGVNKSPLDITFNIYPNPATNKVIVTLPKTMTGISAIILTDISGKRVLFQEYDIPASHPVVEIDVSTLSKGMYGLIITNDDRSLKKKLVIQ